MPQKFLMTASVLVLGFAITNPSQAMIGYPHAETPSPAHLITVNADQKNLDQAVKFIEGVADRGIDFLSDEALTETQKAEKFEKLLSDSFDLKTIGRFTLGRYWRATSDAQRDKFIALFEQNVIDSYTRRFSEYQGQNVNVDSARPIGNNDVLVTSFIVPPNGQKVQVDWRVREKSGSFRIIDIIVEGVSMAVTQRSDFASVIQRGGGDVEVLIVHLQEEQ